MGYEVKIFVVEHRDDNICSDGWCKIIGMVNLCKPGYNDVYDLIKRYQEKAKNIPINERPFWYDNYGKKEFKVREDKYGDNLPLIPICEFLNVIKKDNKKEKQKQGSTYRRFDLAISFLENFLKDDWAYERENLYVMPWGY